MLRTGNVCKSFIKNGSQIREAGAQRCSVKNVFLEISQKYTGKHLCQSFFFNDVAGLRHKGLRRLCHSRVCLRPATLLKMRLWHKCLFSCEFCEISKNTFFYGCFSKERLCHSRFWNQTLERQKLQNKTKIINISE